MELLSQRSARGQIDIGALPRLMAIDGAPGSGKSTLSVQLVQALDAHKVELDDFLIPDQGEFFGALRMHDLAAALTSPPGRIVVSDACIRKVLWHLHLKPDVLVYVKRIAIWRWADQDEIEGDQIKQISAVNGPNAEIPKLHFEVREYHQEFQPQIIADIVFERIEAE